MRDENAREALDRFVRVLRDARRARGVFQRDIAKSVGVTQGAMCAWEVGRSTPSQEHLAAWAGFFGLVIPPDVAGWSLDPCGTHGGWARHRNRREAPCKPCLAARRAYDVKHRTPLIGEAL